jgi:alpha-amylase
MSTRYFPLIRAFQATNGSMEDLVEEISGMKESCKVRRSFPGHVWSIAKIIQDTSLLTTFSENHDQPRFASYTPDIAVSLDQYRPCIPTKT